jgi:glycerol kinase
MSKLIAAIDQGTTGTTVLLVDETATVRGRATVEFEQIYPQPAWVEHDPAAIWSSVTKALGQALTEARLDQDQIVALGLTNQRETTLLWDRTSGRPLHNAIVWQDRRTAPHCEQLKAKGLEPLFRRRTGLVIDPYFAGTKLAWLLDHVDPERTRAGRGELAFGTVDSYLIWRLTGGAAHMTDASNASRTLLFDLVDMRWSDELTAHFGVPREILPTVCGSAEIYGTTRGVPGLRDGIPIAGSAGDQQAALFGQACFDVGDSKCTYGTGAFLLVNTGSEPVRGDSGTLATVAWKLGDETTYALEGSAFIAGAAVQWLRDGLGLFDQASEVETLARQVSDSGGVVFVPALVGLGAPHWKSDARGTISGITRGTTAAHLARATLEGIALQICDLADAMQQDLGREIGSFRVDGGAAANDLLMQLQADLLDLETVRPAVTETTALGAAFLAGLTVGLWPDQTALAATWREGSRFSPTMAPNDRKQLRERWRHAIKRL